MGLRMQPRSEKFFTLISKAGPNVVESAASLTEFVAALHERWAERVVSMYGLVTVFNFCGLTLSTAFDAPKILRRELLPTNSSRSRSCGHEPHNRHLDRDRSVQVWP